MESPSDLHKKHSTEVQFEVWCMISTSSYMDLYNIDHGPQEIIYTQMTKYGDQYIDDS